VPLVYNNDYLLRFGFIDGREEIVISLVNENCFEFREENTQRLDEPVRLVRVKTFFTELGWLTVMKSRNGFSSFVLPEGLS